MQQVDFHYVDLYTTHLRETCELGTREREITAEEVIKFASWRHKVRIQHDPSTSR